MNKINLMYMCFCRYNGMWFGQKEDGMTGCFEREKAVKIDDDDRGN